MAEMNIGWPEIVKKTKKQEQKGFGRALNLKERGGRIRVPFF